MMMSRAVLLLCVTAVIVLSEAPEAGVSAEVVSPQRQLEAEVVKVHVKVHPKEAALQPNRQQDVPAKKRSHKHHKNGGNNKAKNSDTVRDYPHGSVRIASNGAKAAKKLGKGHHKKNDEHVAEDGETMVKYDHGTVKISGQTTSDGETKPTSDKAKKAATPNEQEVTSTANEVNELVTKLSSTPSDKKSFIDAYGPVVVICGIIGGLAAIVGVAGLVMGQTQSKDDNADSILSASDLDVDVEAAVQDAGDDGDDLLDDSDSDAIDDEEEEEGTFANDTAHVSV
ncbi:Hypothetical protein PHPALM_14762 [Phytophthora palmivora]|uniref:Uncharacterized protein n=1 Tax=Phytophthora palmivora TaxID=4796 RepID=A0A2P4XTV8_9STRA|nr:Hypothetical protein PHPALM_14762 [Phytophthora palmivora]